MLLATAIRKIAPELAEEKGVYEGGFTRRDHHRTWQETRKKTKQNKKQAVALLFPGCSLSDDSVKSELRKILGLC